MIPKKTVFILGAGAHCPYGFPDGGKLIEQMVAELPEHPNTQTGFGQCVADLLTKREYSFGNELVELRNALLFSGHASIDSFLRTHRANDFFVDVGRWLVAWLLMPHEFWFAFSRIRPDPAKEDQDWMSYLFTRMLHRCLDSPDEFIAKNRVCFATFNYDRTLEYFLTLKLHNTYPRLTMAAAWELVQKIPILHIYGSLGDFDPAQARHEPQRAPEAVRRKASAIRLMYEERKDGSNTLQKFEQLIKDAHRVVFLGFGFDPDNIDALNLKALLSDVPNGWVMASRFQVPDGEWETMKNNMLPIQIDDRSNSLRVVRREWDALRFLRESKALE